jgi:hypothetical protein
VIEIDELKSGISYDPDTGILTWKRMENRRALWNDRHPGTAIGILDRDGYLHFKFRNQHFRVHRVAWALHHGCWPSKQLDHINGDRADNRISNLREADYLEQGQNRGLSIRNTSGFTGVTYNKRMRLWVANIRANGKKAYLGSAKSPEDAHALYLEAKRKLHGFQPLPREQLAALAAAGQKP